MEPVVVLLGGMVFPIVLIALALLYDLGVILLAIHRLARESVVPAMRRAAAHHLHAHARPLAAH